MFFPQLIILNEHTELIFFHFPLISRGNPLSMFVKYKLNEAALSKCDGSQLKVEENKACASRLLLIAILHSCGWDEKTDTVYLS